MAMPDANLMPPDDAAVRDALRHVAELPALSGDVREIVTRALGERGTPNE